MRFHLAQNLAFTRLKGWIGLGVFLAPRVETPIRQVKQKTKAEASETPRLQFG